MTNSKQMKRALMTSVVALITCFIMLLGTTAAWFTDSVTSSGNVIKTGTLDVAFDWAEGTEDPTTTTWKDASEGAIFNNKLWEPGYVEAKHLRVTNKGSLALKFKLVIAPNGEVEALADVIDVYMISDATQVSNRDDLAGATYVGTLASLIADKDGAAYGKLLAGESDDITIAFKMNQDAGNEYQGLSIGSDFSIVLLATQYTHENDGFGDNQYDVDAYFGKVGFGRTPEFDGSRGYDFDVIDPNVDFNNGKFASVNVPTAAMADGVDRVTATFIETNTPTGITIDDGFNSVTYDINVTGLVENNTTELTIRIYIGEGFDSNTIKVYHESQLIDCYDAGSGYVGFQTATFSPFTVVYDADSEFQNPGAEIAPDQIPVANITTAPQWVGNTTIEWGKYGKWSPAEGYETNLDAAFVYKAPHTVDTIETSEYKDWYCDLFVSISRDIDANEIFLGGNYGDFGWIGFHNDGPVAADTEIPLLLSAASNAWTYSKIACFVGEFTCGVGDVNGNLTGETLTVKLRLINPQDENEFYDVNVVTYTFGGGYTVTNFDPSNP